MISADNFEYDVLENIIIAEKNVIIKNEIEDYTISSDLIKYLKIRKFFHKAKLLQLLTEYNFNSKI